MPGTSILVYVLSNGPIRFDSNYAIHVNRGKLKWAGDHVGEVPPTQFWPSCWKAKIWLTEADALAQQTWFTTRGVTTHITVVKVHVP